MKKEWPAVWVPFSAMCRVFSSLTLSMSKFQSHLTPQELYFNTGIPLSTPCQPLTTLMSTRDITLGGSVTFILAYDNQPFASTFKLGLAILSCPTMFNISHNNHCDSSPSNLVTLLTILWSYTTLKTGPWVTRQKGGLGLLWGVLEVLGVVKR